MRKNEATLFHKGRQFLIWQNGSNEWNYSYERLGDINTFTKELQQALNILYETIDESVPRRTPPDKSKGRQRGESVSC